MLTIAVVAPSLTPEGYNMATHQPPTQVVVAPSLTSYNPIWCTEMS